MGIKHIVLSTLLVSIIAVLTCFGSEGTTLPDVRSPQDSLTRQSYPFILPDSTEKLVKSTDFKGKLVVLEFWFTGCVPCLALAKSMESVINHFESHEDVVFVSINLDRDKEKWFRGLNNGAMLYGEFNQHADYVHPKAISLSTQPYGFEHPIIDYYSITGVPALIIVGKEGEILDRNPPRPGLTRKESINEFITLLESYLAKPKNSE